MPNNLQNYKLFVMNAVVKHIGYGGIQKGSAHALEDSRQKKNNQFGARKSYKIH